MHEPLTIWLDFDGTIVEHAYPAIGQLNPHASEVIEKLQNAGHRIILNTTRIEFNNRTFEEALAYLKEQGIALEEYTPKKLYPLPFNIESIILHREIFIDDMAANIPLTFCNALQGIMVDWVALERLFLEKGLIS
jgi:predicted mannosyl-3-phosphoglycerate phosphatase (HAD superfamily)